MVTRTQNGLISKGWMMGAGGERGGNGDEDEISSPVCLERVR